ncbi:cytochrome c [Flavobacterium suaedae]|nr:cytochrome c [Flavobacterium suaedae]
MKNITKIIVVLTVFGLYSCDSNTYEDIEEDSITDDDIPVVITYDAHVKQIVDANCVTCHSAGATASFLPLTNYMEVKDAVENTDLLDRIQRQNGQPGLMPQTGRMPMNNIDAILEWNMDGLLEN